MTDLTCVINTAACGAGQRVFGGHAYDRADILREVIIPQSLKNHGRLIVVGEWDDPLQSANKWSLLAGNAIIHQPQVYHSSDDAVLQRQRALEQVDTPFVLLQHDDHLVDPVPIWRRISISELMQDTVCVPTRMTRRGGREREINNGFPDYISGHAALWPTDLARRVWPRISPSRTWDISSTKLMKEEGAALVQLTDWRCWDLDFGAHQL